MKKQYEPLRNLKNEQVSLIWIVEPADPAEDEERPSQTEGENPSGKRLRLVCEHFVLGLPDGSIVEVDEEDEEAFLNEGLECLDWDDEDGNPKDESK